MITWAKGHQNGIAMESLPLTMKEIEKLPRSYIANVIYKIAKKPFKDWTN